MPKILGRLELACSENDAAKIISAAIKIVEAVHEGIIVELPCKVGTIVFTIYGFHCPICNKDHSRIELRQFELSMAFDIGKTVFLTQAEAEKRLEGKKK